MNMINQGFPSMIPNPMTINYNYPEFIPQQQIIQQINPPTCPYYSYPIKHKCHEGWKNRAKFTKSEDKLLKQLVNKYGDNDWALISGKMQGRNCRQCKERWCNYLSPKLNKTKWKASEDDLLIKKVDELGRKWVAISKFFHNRTDQMLKNRYNVLMRIQRSFCNSDSEYYYEINQHKHKMLPRRNSTIDRPIIIPRPQPLTMLAPPLNREVCINSTSQSINEENNEFDSDDFYTDAIETKQGDEPINDNPQQQIQEDVEPEEEMNPDNIEQQVDMNNVQDFDDFDNLFDEYDFNSFNMNENQETIQSLK